jgi:hypothetical protein
VSGFFWRSKKRTGIRTLSESKPATEPPGDPLVRRFTSRAITNKELSKLEHEDGQHPSLTGYVMTHLFVCALAVVCWLFWVMVFRPAWQPLWNMVRAVINF